MTAVTCPECGRRFDLTDEVDADEWANGHDCEAPETPPAVSAMVRNDDPRSPYGITDRNLNR